jgi:BirA family transcriptional regulator, biotin operon repressor / biotin---[acetyl-CoA-carboxylase] ligase
MADAAALDRALAGRGQPALALVEWPDELPSTSDRLKALARAGAAEWTAVLADRQTGGRGREGRAWASPAGGLYLSVLLRPRFTPVGLLPLAAGVAVAEAVAEWGVAARLKWPNDVLLGGRKLGGILAEAASGAAGVEWVALGIGVNVAVPGDALPVGLREHVASLAEETSARPPIADVAAAVLAHLRVCYDGLRTDSQRIVESWRARAVDWWGDLVNVETARETLQGRMRGVDAEGALLVDLEGGRRLRILSGEVHRLRRAVRE